MGKTLVSLVGFRAGIPSTLAFAQISKKWKGDGASKYHGIFKQKVYIAHMKSTSRMLTHSRFRFYLSLSCPFISLQCT
ncbi:hypothetical protein SUGI_0166450 [Cryptomeria japonica]|nr:hypothetical protein SUGI_0166450 [Cryptomeria japonica]